jgi:hypothetical protein
LHNFCIGELPEGEEITIPKVLDVDTLNIVNHADGNVELEDIAHRNLTNLPLALMHGGEHFDDITHNKCKKHKR